jgi:putative FmdB family regulatory protein
VTVIKIPIFDYFCKGCSNLQEHFVKNRDEKIVCDVCGTVMEKQFSGKVSFDFKGFGFPTNDDKLFRTPPDAVEKLENAGLKRKNKMDVTDA